MQRCTGTQWQRDGASVSGAWFCSPGQHGCPWAPHFIGRGTRCLFPPHGTFGRRKVLGQRRGPPAPSLESRTSLADSPTMRDACVAFSSRPMGRHRRAREVDRPVAEATFRKIDQICAYAWRRHCSIRETSWARGGTHTARSRTVEHDVPPSSDFVARSCSETPSHALDEKTFARATRQLVAEPSSQPWHASACRQNGDASERSRPCEMADKLDMGERRTRPKTRSESLIVKHPRETVICRASLL